MGSMIALIGSFVIGGLVLLSLQGFNQDFSQEMFRDTLDNVAYSNLDNVKRIIEYDFSRIGLGLNDPSQDVLTNVGATDVTFLLDSDGIGAVETMRYYLSTTTDAAAATTNPNDRVLFRVVNNGAAQTVSAGLTDFRIQYFNSGGVETAAVDQIRTVVVSLTLESDYASFTGNGEYPKLVWQERFTPPSLVVH